MIVRVAGTEDAPRWDDFVERHPESTPYHLFAWKKAVEDAYGHAGKYLMAEKGNEVRGVLPLVHMKILGCFNHMVALPFCDRAGILADSPDVGQELIRAAVSLASSKKAATIELRGLGKDAPFLEASPYPVVTRSFKVEMLLDLPLSSGRLWSDFPSKLRSQVRRGLKNGLEFKWAGFDGVEAFYYVYGRNMKRLGSPAHSKKWMNSVLLSYGANARLGLIYSSGDPVAGGIMLILGKNVCIPWASTLIDYNHLSPGMLLYWRFLEYAADNGFNQFDFGRSTPEEGTYKFKAQWGAQPKPLHWHQISLGKKHASPEVLKHRNRRLAERIWRKIPFKAANWIGPIIRKHISL